MLRTVIAAVVSGILGLHGRAQAQWQMVNPQPNLAPVTSISVSSPSTRETFMLSSDPDGTWISYGGNFQPNPPTPPKLRWEFDNALGINEVHTSRVAYAPSDPQRVYAQEDHSFVSASRSGGASGSWKKSFQCSATAQPGCDPNRPWRALAVHPTNPDIVLIGGAGQNSIWRTTDGACSTPPCSWNPVGTGAPQNVTVTDIEFDRWDTGTLDDLDAWAATATVGGSSGPRLGVLYSPNQDNWFSILLDPDASSDKNQVYAIAVAAPLPAAGLPESFLAATEAGLYRCTSGTSGTSSCLQNPSNWLSLNVPVSPPRINDVFFAQDAAGPKIWVGTEQGVFRGDVNTNTGAVTWNHTTQFPPNPVTALGSTLSTPQMLYAGYRNGDVRVTLDGGANVYRVVGQHGGYPIGTLVHISGDKIYTGTVCQQGIFQYDGTSWMKPSLDYDRNEGGPFHYMMRIVVDPNSSLGTVAYATADDLFKTMDGGATWMNLSAKPCGSPCPLCGTHVHGIAVSPRDSTGKTLYLSSGHGIWGHNDDNSDPPRFWKSTDGGGTWTGPTLFCTPNSATCNQQQFANFAKVFVQGWEDTAIESSLFDIAVSPLDPGGDGDDVYIATFGHEQFPADYTKGRGQGVLRSTDGGATWQLLNAGLSIDGQSVGRITMHNPGGTVTTYIATLGGMYKMVGNGSSWTLIRTGRFESVAFDPATNPLVLYAGTSPNQTGVCSNNGQPCTTNNDCTGASCVEGAIIDAEIYKSIDGGGSWSPMSITMPTYSAWTVRTRPPYGFPNYRVRDIAVGSTKVYASVEGAGIYVLNK